MLFWGHCFCQVLFYHEEKYILLSSSQSPPYILLIYPAPAPVTWILPKCVLCVYIIVRATLYNYLIKTSVSKQYLWHLYFKYVKWCSCHSHSVPWEPVPALRKSNQTRGHNRSSVRLAFSQWQELHIVKGWKSHAKEDFLLTDK